MTGVARRPRVALVAFTAQPGQGSEYEVGWRWALLAARIVRPVVLTRRACWDAIPAPAHSIGGQWLKRSNGVLFVAVDIPRAPRLFPGRRLMRSHYLLWQVLVLAWLRRRRRCFGFVHHVTFVAAWFPPFAAFAGLPFVWGPIGTNPPMPEFYRARLGRIDRFRAALRTFVTQSLVRYNPLLPLVGRRSAGAFAISDHVRGLLPAAMRERTRVHPAIGIGGDWFEGAGATGGRNDTMLFVGRAMDIKLPRLAYRVMRSVIAHRPKTRGVMIGEGLPAMLSREPSCAGVALREHIPQDDLRKLYHDAGLLLFPSVEASGFVTLEALASGLPVACIEGFGAAAFAGREGPLVMPVDGGWDAVHDRLVEAIVNFLDRPAAQRAVAAAEARVRAQAFAWDNYLRFLGELYSSAMCPADGDGCSSRAILE